MADEILKFTLRIPKEILDKVRVLAEMNGRSLNKEIEMILKDYIKKNSKFF